MIQVCIVCMYQCPSDLVVDGMDGRTRYLLRYGTVLPLGGEGMLVCMYACTCAGLGGAGLGGAVLCGAVLVRCGACAVRCWLHCRSLMKKDESKG